VGLFFEVILVAVLTWLMGRSALQWRRERRLARATTGIHDAGVWVNERAWMGIVSGLEGDHRPPAGHRDQAARSEQLGRDGQDRSPGRLD
jgi:hypothetical protein